MRCPHLTKDVVYVCDLGNTLGVLDTPVLRKYCKCARFRGCGRYIDSTKNVGYYYQLETVA